ncbi:MAG: hypothetical protein JJU36_07320 [Phycisphaeraceae bacterium]|nr:hypothetical protein [Phycisphaeraceae bacterium]
MAGIWTAIRDLLARLFGGGDDTARRLKALGAMRQRLTAAKRDNEDSLHALKDDIRLLEARAVHKKRELDQVHGDSKRIVVGEIDRIFRELDGLRGRENIIAANLERIRVALAKVDEAEAALRAGVTEEQFDELAFEIQGLFSELKTLDRAAADLDRERYEPPATSKVDVDQRVEEVQGAREAPVTLSPETEKRLKQLETE